MLVPNSYAKLTITTCSHCIFCSVWLHTSAPIRKKLCACTDFLFFFTLIFTLTNNKNNNVNERKKNNGNTTINQRHALYGMGANK